MQTQPPFRVISNIEESERAGDGASPTASWHRVIIPDDDIAVADINARGLMSEYVMAHLAYVVQHGLTHDDVVYHDTHGERGHVYYFSPQASTIGAEVLREYSATACAEPHNLTELRKKIF